MLRGLMMEMQLLISSLIEHASNYHGDTEIVSRLTEGGQHRTTYRKIHGRMRKLANALTRLGVKQGDRIATLAWNNYRHLEIYYAVPCMGAVCHTVNPRLFPEQLVYIINHAEDQYVFFETTFLKLVEGVAPKCPGVKGWVVMADRAHMPQSSLPLLCYEELVEAEADDFEWPVFDENSASSLCYTSGTTGNPKGVLYSHRSTLIHTLAGCSPDVLNLAARDSMLPVVPMFHANAWGLPYIACMVGCKLVMPGMSLDGPSVYELLEQEKVTMTAGVPTVWLALLQYMEQNNLKFSTVKTAVIGGSAAPEAMIRKFAEMYGVYVLHAWGMTEMSPLGTTGQLKAKHLNASPQERYKIQGKQGRVVFGVQLKIVDGDGKELPHDGKSAGDVMVKGPWICSKYFKQEGSPLVDGWFPTGDVANVDEDGYLQITDRSKDVIKSGGEWISSIDLENAMIAHPAVAEAAVVGVRHPKWDERPLLILVKKPGANITREEALEFLKPRVAKWWLPNDVVFVEQLPHTATGKLLKTKLREEFGKHKWPAETA
jgi:acyl-CoA synthetase (AMP-forming)/AMP-acid ligase II